VYCTAFSVPHRVATGTGTETTSELEVGFLCGCLWRCPWCCLWCWVFGSVQWNGLSAGYWLNLLYATQYGICPPPPRISKKDQKIAAAAGANPQPRNPQSSRCRCTDNPFPPGSAKKKTMIGMIGNMGACEHITSTLGGMNESVDMTRWTSES
jgi:hypothetical protein